MPFKSTNREYAQRAVIPSINYFGFSHFFVRVNMDINDTFISIIVLHILSFSMSGWMIGVFLKYVALTFQVLGQNAILITFKCRDSLQLHFHTELFIFQPLAEWDFIIPVSLFQYFYLFAWRSESWFCLIVHLFINSCLWYSVAVWTNRSFKLSDSGK